MFVRILNYRVKPGQFAAFERTFRDTVFPELERVPGFMRVILAGDAQAHAGILFTMWQSAAHAGRFEDEGVSHRLFKHVSDLIAEAPAATGYPVLFDREF